VAAVDAAGIQDANGNTFSLTNGLAVLLDDEKQTWADCWYDIRKGDTVTVFYSAAGTVDLLWVRARAAGRALKGGIVVLTLTMFRRFWSAYVE